MRYSSEILAGAVKNVFLDFSDHCMLTLTRAPAKLL